MISFIKGDIFLSKDEALINPVNIVGVSGKGLALQFKVKYPLNFNLYKNACFKHEIQIGKMFTTRENNKIIINFPTKKHWRNLSKIKYINSGLDSLILLLQQNNIKSVSIPPLGCGCGELNWDDVKQLLIKKLSILNNVIINIYEP